jgi:hypothetical protein
MDLCRTIPTPGACGPCAMGVVDARKQLNGPQARARPLLSSSASPEAITTRVSMPSSTE